MAISVDLKIPFKSENASVSEGAVDGIAAAYAKQVSSGDDFYAEAAPLQSSLKPENNFSLWHFFPLLGLFANGEVFRTSYKELNRTFQDCVERMIVSDNVPEKVLYSIWAAIAAVDVAIDQYATLSNYSKKTPLYFFETRVNRSVAFLLRAHDGIQVAVDMLEQYLDRHEAARVPLSVLHSFLLECRVYLMIAVNNLTLDKVVYRATVENIQTFIEHLLEAGKRADLFLARKYLAANKDHFDANFTGEVVAALKARGVQMAETVDGPTVKLDVPKLSRPVIRIGNGVVENLPQTMKLTMLFDMRRADRELRCLMLGLDKVKTRIEKISTRR